MSLCLRTHFCHTGVIAEKTRLRFPPPPRDGLAVLYLEDTDAPIAGRVEGTRYAYFKTIARGGRSIIQSCKDLRLSRVVCYKTLRPEFSTDPTARQRFLREARVTAMLVHPNTVPVYDLGEDRHQRLYFTMKFVHGYTFREVLNYRERYDINQLVEVLLQVTRALAYAHTHGVVHRDVKPENILVGPFGEVLLMDWGLAKVRSRSESAVADEAQTPVDNHEPSGLSDHEQLQGTVSYMSPEQIRRDPDIDGRSDIFSLGAVLYEILAGRPPAVGNTVEEILQAVRSEQPVPPSSLSKHEVPPRLQDICLRCLEKDPDTRMPSASQLVRELTQDWIDANSRKPWRR